MTVRERLMVELAALSDKDFYEAVDGKLDQTITDRLCIRCVERHGGQCPLGEDDCLLFDGRGMRDEWDGAPILTEVSAP